MTNRNETAILRILTALPLTARPAAAQNQLCAIIRREVAVYLDPAPPAPLGLYCCRR